MPARPPAWSRLGLVLILVLQAILPVHAASAPPTAARVEPAPMPAVYSSNQLLDRVADVLRQAQYAISTLASTSTLTSPFTSPLPTPAPTPVPARTAPLALAL